MAFVLGEACVSCGRTDAHTETESGECAECAANRDPAAFRRTWAQSPLDPSQIHAIAYQVERVRTRRAAGVPK